MLFQNAPWRTAAWKTKKSNNRKNSGLNSMSDLGLDTINIHRSNLTPLSASANNIQHNVTSSSHHNSIDSSLSNGSYDNHTHPVSTTAGSVNMSHKRRSLMIGEPPSGEFSRLKRSERVQTSLAEAPISTHDVRATTSKATVSTGALDISSSKHGVEEAVADPGLTVDLDLSTMGLKGRHTHMEQLLSTVQAGGRSIIVLSGKSGSGKTRLVHEFSQSVHHQMVFGSGKFEQFDKVYDEPYAPLLHAVSQAVETVLETADAHVRKAIQESLRKRLTESQRLQLTELIPDILKLCPKVGTEDTPIAERGRLERWERYAEESMHTETDDNDSFFEDHFDYADVVKITLALRSLILALASGGQSLVLFLDDAQWAEEQTLQSIFAIVMDSPVMPDEDCSDDEEDDGKSISIEFADNVKNDIGGNETTQLDDDKAKNRSQKRFSTTSVINLSLIVAFRNAEEEGEEHTTKVTVDWIRQTLDNSKLSLATALSGRDRSITHIELGPLDFGETNHIISTALQLDAEKTQPLADVIYRKTNGNPYSILLFLELLYREKLLSYSFLSYQWEWNLDLIQSETNVSENVMHLLSKKIEELPFDIKSVLRLAACLGFYFDIRILKEVVLREGLLSDTARQSAHNTRESKMAALNKKRSLHSRSRRSLGGSQYNRLMASRYTEMVSDQERRDNEALCAAWLVIVLGRAQREGLIERASNTQYKFSHDRVQRSLYESTPEGRPRYMLHLRVGRLARESYVVSISENDREKQVDARTQNAMLFFAVEQLNMAASFITDDEERIGLVQLNLEASEIAGDNLTFLAAARFLRYAVALIRDTDWRASYALCLEVFSSVAEIEHSCGNASNAMNAITEVLRNAKNFEDKIRVLFLKMNDLGTRGLLSEAIEEGRAALESLGEPLPKKIGIFHALREVGKTKKALSERTREQLLDLPLMTDTSKKQAVRFLNSLSIFAWHVGDEGLQAAIYLRLMNLNLIYGQTQWTPFTFATFAMLLAAYGDTDSAAEFSLLALEMLPRAKTFIALPRTHLIVYTFVNHIQHPLLHGIEPLLSAHRIGIESGELEYGSLAVSSYASLYVIFGLPLPNFSSDMRTISEQLYHFHQHVALSALLPWWQFGLNLMGECDNELVLTGEAMDEHEFRQNVQGNTFVAVFDLLQLMIYYLFDELDFANEAYKRLESTPESTLASTHYINHFRHCYCALLHLRLARESPKNKASKRLARKHVSVLDKLSRSGAVNCSVMIGLIRAEEYALGRDKAKAKAAYEGALARFARSGFMHLGAITNERAGFFMYECGDTYWAANYLSQAIRNYAEWGARAKVKNLSAKCRHMNFGPHKVDLSALSASEPSVSLKGRPRFKATPMRLRASFMS